MTDNSKRVLVPRITQLDANEFDRVIHGILSSQFFEISNFLKPGILSCIKSEISLALNFFIFYYSVVTKNATFGQELLGLKYKDALSKNKLTVYACLNYVLPYFKNKYENHSIKIDNLMVKKTLDKIELFVKMSHLVNTLLFLREGKYPTICDRILGLTYSPVNKLSRAVGYSYMTRELLWHGFTELLLNVLPMINYKALKRNVVKRFIGKSNGVKQENVIAHNIDTKCAICDEFPVLPCQVSKFCPHISCYYCVKSAFLGDEKFVCPVCLESNTVGDELTFLGS